DKSLTSLESTARLVKNWSLFNLTALVEYTDNFQSYSNDETLQKYPEITFTGLKQPILDSPIDFELESSYVYYYRTTGYSGHLFDANPEFSWSLGLGDYLEFTPTLGLRETIWESAYSGPYTGMIDKDSSRELYTLGATLSSEVHRVFEVDGEVVDKIRHGVIPELEYSYIPYVDQTKIPDFLSEIAETNTMTWSLTNVLIARLKDENGGISYNEFLRLKLSQSYDIREARKHRGSLTTQKRPFGSILAELNFDPFHYFSLEADAQFDVNSGEWEEMNSRFEVSDVRGDSLAAEYRYTQDSVEEVNFTLKGKATESLDLMYVLRKDLLCKRNIETTYGVNYHRQCWSILCSYSDSPDDREYMIIFSLYGFGKVGNLKSGLPEW
ncbi:MAG: LPS assembly protein LptD, partial [Thermodesulfobacteriota bacterium]|nr:LPS assembly protein LptD [Thermodesulfobacteriota bacterium]